LSERALLAGLLAAHAIHNFFVFDNLVSYMLFLVILSYIAYRAHDGLGVISTKLGTPVSSAVFASSSSAIVIAFALIFYFANVPGMAAASSLIESIKAHPEGVSKNLELFKETAKYTGIGRQEVREQLVQFALQIRKQDNAGDQKFKDEVAAYAIQQMQDEIARNPNDARLHIFLGSFLRQLGDTEGAHTELTKAMELSPKKQTILLEIGILYHDKGDVKTAQEWIKRAYDLEPKFDTARSFYAVTAIETGDRKLAEDLLMPRYGTLTPDDPYILQAYLSVKDLVSVAGVLENRVKANPTDAQAHLQLASAYLNAGNRAGSIDEIKKAIELNPEFKSQGESYIKDIEAGRTPQ
jgi:cytochrome c-type biogenesis protein CcmH/NrfG